MRFVVTGVAGFIGSHLATRLIEQGHEVLGIDSVNSYYDTGLKRDRLARIQGLPSAGNLIMVEADIAVPGVLEHHVKEFAPDYFVHLAAQAGVRHSLHAPQEYVSANLVGFFHVLESLRHHPVKHFIYASSSSVYGNQDHVPFSERDKVDAPVSLYAATKKSNELMAHSYSHLFGIPSTGVRFFTVYGAWGRPDMAYYSFTSAIAEGREIRLFNHGNQKRDFTYIDDVVRALEAVIPLPPLGSTSSTGAPYRILNIGNNRPVPLLRFVNILEELLGRSAILKLVEAQPGDVPETYADVVNLRELTGFAPEWTLEQGLERFVTWYRGYHGVPPT